MKEKLLPIGMNFMEVIPACPVDGKYDTRKHILVNEKGEAALLTTATVTGSNASTGWDEGDTNEDFDA